METTEISLKLNFNRRQISVLLAFFLLAWHPGFIGSETLTLTTYYPAPYGGYVSLLTTNQTILARDGGRVGIGTTPTAVASPFGTVLAVNSGTGQGNVLIGGAGDGNETYSALHLSDSSLDIRTNSWGFVHKKRLGLSEANDLQIVRWLGNTMRMDMIIDGPSGNIGIGTSGPTEKLHIANGNIRVDSGNITLVRNSGTNLGGNLNFVNNGYINGICSRVPYSIGPQAFCPAGARVMGFMGDGVARVWGFLPLNQTSTGVGRYIVLGEDWGGTMVCCRIN